jgi:hypothetical protein
MTQSEQIEIPISKKKMTLTFLVSLVFVGIGLWFLINPPKFSSPLFGNPTYIFIVGLASILFFGFIAVSIFLKFKDKIPGLTINREGILDNSSNVSAGLIPWGDINEIKVLQVMSQKFLMIIVSNPQDYLDKVSNPFKRNVMKTNYKTFGSPISISSNSLKTNFDELQKLLLEKMKEY